MADKGNGIGRTVVAREIMSTPVLTAYRSATVSEAAALMLVNRVGKVFIWVSLLVGLFFGLSAQGEWREWLLFDNAQDFGIGDPQFGVDIGYYVFELPFWQFLLGVGFSAITIGLIGALVVHFLYGGVRVSGSGDRITAAARGHITLSTPASVTPS